MRPTLVLLVALLAVAPPARTQTMVPPNTRVRVVSWNGQRVIGRLADARGDTLVVVQDGLLWSPTFRIPVDGRTRVDVSRGKYVHAGRVIGGALLGALGGFLAVTLVPGLSKTECSADVCGTSAAVGEGLIVGLAAGFTLGLLTRADRWEAVLPPVRVGFGSDNRRARLAIALSF